MGIKESGKLAIVAGAGPMGLGALTYALYCDRKPGLVVSDGKLSEHFKKYCEEADVTIL